MTTITVLGGIFIVSIISYALRDVLGGVYPLLITASIIVFAIYAITNFMPLLEEIRAIISFNDESGEIVSIIVRVFLISIAVEILGSVCQDLGMTSYKMLIIVFGNFAIVAVMLPLITSVLSQVISYIDSV